MTPSMFNLVMVYPRISQDLTRKLVTMSGTSKRGNIMQRISYPSDGKQESQTANGKPLPPRAKATNRGGRVIRSQEVELHGRNWNLARPPLLERNQRGQEMHGSSEMSQGRERKGEILLASPLSILSSFLPEGSWGTQSPTIQSQESKG